MAVKATLWSLTAENRIQQQKYPRGTYGRKGGTDRGFSPNISDSPVSIIPPFLHTHSDTTETV